MLTIIQTGPKETKITKLFQREIAKELRVSEAYISMCLKGRRQLNQRQAARIERKLGIPTNFWPRLAA